MTELKLIAYMSDGKSKALDVSSKDKSALSVNATAASTIISTRMTRSLAPQSMTVSARMIQPDTSPLVCRSGVKLLLMREVFNAAKQVETIRLTSVTPKSPDFIRTQVVGERSGVNWQWDAGYHSEDIPSQAGQDAALYIKGWANQPNSPLPIPGERLIQTSTYRRNTPVVATAQYYSALGVTGGRIWNRVPHPNKPHAFLYSVDVEGFSLVDLLATDLRIYQIGDWVQVLRVIAETGTLDPVEHVVQTPDKYSGAFVYRVSPVNVVVP